MLDKWILGLVISFVLRQVAKFEKAVDWVKVLADGEARLRQLVPGEWFDNEVVAYYKAAVNACHAALKDEKDLGAILALVAEQKWLDAALKLKDLVLEYWNPEDELGVRVKSDFAGV